MTQETKMVQGQDPSYLTGFHPRIIRRGESFCVYIPEWRVSGEGTSLEKAYRQFERNKNIFEEHRKKFGLATVSPDPYPVLKNRDVLRELSLFFVKTAVGVAAAILVIVLLMPNVRAAVSHQVNKLKNDDPTYLAVKLPAKLNERLDRLSAADQEIMRNEWSRLLQRISCSEKSLGCR